MQAVEGVKESKRSKRKILTMRAIAVSQFPFDLFRADIILFDAFDSFLTSESPSDKLTD